MAIESVGHWAYYFYQRLQRWWGALVPQEYSEDRIVFKLSCEDAVELDSLGEGFTGLAREFQHHLAEQGVDPKAAPAKLFVTDLKKSSIEFEVATILSLYGIAHAGADAVVIWTEFYDKLKKGLSYLAGKGPRPAKFDRSDAENLDAFLKTVKHKKKSKINIKRAKFHHETGDRKTIAEFEFNEQDIANADMTLARELGQSPDEAAPPGKSHRRENGVPFMWFRVDKDKAKSSGQTSDRAIVPKISEKPLAVYFASEIDNYKDLMIRQRFNPFNLIYTVDVSIAYNEKTEPVSYTILNLHHVIGPDGQPINLRA